LHRGVANESDIVTDTYLKGLFQLVLAGVLRQQWYRHRQKAEPEQENTAAQVLDMNPASGFA
jgi:hypothetical protein